jgi:Tol biopolymer transport system component
MARYTDDRNLPLALEPGGASGGEGTVHGITNQPDKIAKIYHPHKLTDGELAEKLRVMIAYPPDDPMRVHGHLSIAWPESRVFDNGTFVGYVMPRIKQPYEIIEFYNPAIRRQKHSGFTWRNLHAIARNLAADLAAVHARGYVVGDINQGNIFVNDFSLVTLIDTDSFQIRDPRTGKLYRSKVGKGEFTPAELQGQNLNKVDRFDYHDLFGLGVLTFQLLMEGFHPFTGVSKSQTAQSGQTVFERNIGQGNFPYDPASAFTPPPAAPDFDILAPQLRALFLRCFVAGHTNPSQRPTALQWHSALASAESQLRSCPRNAQHWYGNHLSECPWCKREKLLNVVPPGASGTRISSAPLQSPSAPLASASAGRRGVLGPLIALLVIGALLFGAWSLIDRGAESPQGVIAVQTAPTRPVAVASAEESAELESAINAEDTPEIDEADDPNPVATATVRPTRQPTRRPPTPTIRSVSPTSRRGNELVFQSDRDGDYEIYIAGVDGSDERQLTSNSATDEFPRISPDGRRIVFVSDRDGNDEIYVMNRDGSDQTRLTFDPEVDRLPAWSPDSRQITFQTARYGVSDIVIIDADGSNLRQVADTPEREGHTSWSVDDRLVYNASSELYWQIYVSDLGGNRQKLTNSRIDEWSPEWSPDGERILFLSERDSSVNSGIFVMDADGGNVRLLYNSPATEWGAVWSADGRQIAFTVDMPNGTAAIYLMDADGGNARKVIDRGSYPSWAIASSGN